MDPETSKKVDDLLGLVEGISTEMDIGAELKSLSRRLEDVEKRLEEMAQRMELLEKAHKERQKIIERLRKELKGLFP